jgi:PadR family transcriptional regulator PadR
MTQHEPGTPAPGRLGAPKGASVGDRALMIGDRSAGPLSEREGILLFDKAGILSYSRGMRRKEDTILPIEVDVLELGIEQQRAEPKGWHGFGMAKALQRRHNARSLISQGGLYKALDRMETRKWLESAWETPDGASVQAPRPRRLYRVTALGAHALATLPRAATKQWGLRAALGLGARLAGA